jgi:3-phenylpropionate/cinnamic acid dioxygenase small subunit
MAITREMLQARLADLRAGHAKAAADMNATAGAIQDCEYWLAEINKSDQAEVVGLRSVGESP